MLLCFTDGSYTIRTPNTERTNITVSLNTHRSHFIFEVTSAVPVHVYLATDLAHYHYGFEIGRSNNSTLLIKYDWPNVESVLYTRKTPGILDPYEPRYFWVSWHGGKLTTGRGKTVDQDVLLSYWDASEINFITSLGLRSSYHSMEGWAEWTFSKDYGNC